MLLALILSCSCLEWELVQELKTDANSSLYGHSIAYSKQRFVVGANWENNMTYKKAGALYIYDYDALQSKYVLKQKIIETSGLDFQGRSVEIKATGTDVRITSDGKRIITSASSSNVMHGGSKITSAGCILVYDLNESTDLFERVNILTVAVPKANTGLGRNLDSSSDGKYIAAAATDKFVVQTNMSGEVFVFTEQTSNSWVVTNPLVPNGISFQYDSRVGSDLQFMDASTLMIATNARYSNMTGAFTFKKQGDDWIQNEEAVFPIDPTGTTFLNYGDRLAMPDDTKSFLAFTAAGANYTEGAIYIVAKNSSDIWDSNPVQTIKLPEGWHLYDVDFCGQNNLVLFDPLYSGTSFDNGGVMYYVKENGQFVMKSEIFPPHNISHQMFGSAVSFSEDCKTMIIGAHSKGNPFGEAAGEAYSDNGVYVYRVKEDSNDSDDDNTTLIVVASIAGGAIIIGLVVFFSISLRKNKQNDDVPNTI